MFHLGMFLFSAVLFFVLTPGVLVSLPPKGKKYTVVAVHALIFAVVWTFTYKAVWHVTEGFESPSYPQTTGLQNNLLPSPQNTNENLYNGVYDDYIPINIKSIDNIVNELAKLTGGIYISKSQQPEEEPIFKKPFLPPPPSNTKTISSSSPSNTKTISSSSPSNTKTISSSSPQIQKPFLPPPLQIKKSIIANPISSPK